MGYRSEVLAQRPNHPSPRTSNLWSALLRHRDDEEKEDGKEEEGESGESRREGQRKKEESREERKN
eukprot:27856-Rhodomonas_salina.1